VHPSVPVAFFCSGPLSGLIHKGDTTQSKRSVSSAWCRCAAIYLSGERYKIFGNCSRRKGYERS
jgi:hypothetical protein